MENKKVSIVVPCYGTEKYVERCIKSLICQTYKNLEIIMVNDASPNGMEKILEKYKKQDKRIKVETHKKNKGLFHSRLTGADVSTGDYICFVDSDDYISVDYIRNLVFDIERKKADMVFCQTVVEDGKSQYIYNLFDFHLEELCDDDCINYYFNQRGTCYRWHTVWNKLYKIDLWKKARDYYNEIKTHLIMTEDFAFSTVLFYFCRKIVFNEYANYYYCMNSDASTSLKKANYNKFYKNINDIFASFKFIQNFLKKVKKYKEFEERYTDWFNNMLKTWYDNVVNSDFNDEEKDKLVNMLLDKNASIDQFEFKNETNFYNVTSPYNREYENIVDEIVHGNYEIVSFDIFDTLISRPFFEPKDLFLLLNKKFKQLYPDISVNFGDIRCEAEALCRERFHNENYYEEVTLDEIYDEISSILDVDYKNLTLIKKYEISLELQFCKARRSGKNLFELAKYVGKKVIITSDIYLPRIVIEGILKENGYKNIDRIYLSCEEKLSKSTSQLYKVVISQENVLPSKILHIGDNYLSDIENARKLGICAKHLPRAMDVMLPRIQNIFRKGQGIIENTNFQFYTGLRNSLALVANKFFDNPFISFDMLSDYNCNPAYVGYFALGMHTFALTKWMFDDLKAKDYDSIAFMARDGFLVKKEFDLFNSVFKSKVKTSYLPISRKSLLPFTFSKREEFIRILDYFASDLITVTDLYNIFKDVLVDDFNPDDYNNLFDTHSDFARFIVEHIIPNVDESKLQQNREKMKNYFLEFYLGKCATFDIGYSAKPENAITKMIGKKVDTYFVHLNNNEGFYYAHDAGINLNVFYDFKPRFTGTLREYIMSDLSGSCKKYDCSKDTIQPIFEDINVDYYEKWILDIIHRNAFIFVKDMLDNFSEWIDDMFFPKYNMSIPFEYFLPTSIL